MARQRMVTRTVVYTVATVLCLNTETAEPYNDTISLSGTFKDEKAILKQCKKLLENDTVSVAKVVDVQTAEKLFGMPEQEFMSYAKELPPRTPKQ